uniref:Uncharacterized protein n=1 Tax=Arcella intermedia TaxID=1963864 RepID=A0A6B2LNP2_9EUKA
MSTIMTIKTKILTVTTLMITTTTIMKNSKAMITKRRIHSKEIKHLIHLRDLLEKIEKVLEEQEGIQKQERRREVLKSLKAPNLAGFGQMGGVHMGIPADLHIMEKLVQDGPVALKTPTKD